MSADDQLIRDLAAHALNQMREPLMLAMLLAPAERRVEVAIKAIYPLIGLLAGAALLSSKGRGRDPTALALDVLDEFAAFVRKRGINIDAETLERVARL